MKHLALAFLIIGLSGGLFITFAGSAHLMVTPASAQSETSRSAYALRQKYLISILDQVQLAAKLQDSCPESVPEWFEVKLVKYVEELNQDLRGHAFAREVLQTICDYYVQCGKPIPEGVHAVFLKELKTYESQVIQRTRSIELGDSMAARNSECDSTQLPITTAAY